MPKQRSGGKLAAVSVFTVLFVGAILFVPAGTAYWPEGWLFIAFLVGYVAFVGSWLAKNNPELAKKRTSFKAPEKAWDKIAMVLLAVFMFGQLVVAGLDYRFGWTAVHPALKAIGFAGIGFTLYTNFLVMRENTFASRIVEVQKGQKVIETGPYSVVRHPMYAGFLPFMIGTALALGSLYALLPGALSAIALIARAWMEDKTLQKELPGYKQYAEKVRYRLLPGLW
jgi:protein-S-isoprenylcysteine O-methyltransferase Ste14